MLKTADMGREGLKNWEKLPTWEVEWKFRDGGEGIAWENLPWEFKQEQDPAHWEPP